VQKDKELRGGASGREEEAHTGNLNPRETGCQGLGMRSILPFGKNLKKNNQNVQVTNTKATRNIVHEEKGSLRMCKKNGGRGRLTDRKGGTNDQRKRRREIKGHWAEG